TCAAGGARPGRSTILTEPGNFPTDLHVAEGVAGLLPGRQVRTVAADCIAAAIDTDTAIVLLTHVHYKTGWRHDMAAICRAARAAGALTLWDLSHSVGAVPVDLGQDGADLAVGCGYKYLNGGPGAPAFLFARRGLQGDLASPVSGWMGHAQPFAFGDEWAAAAGMARFLAGTPPILGMAALEAGVQIVEEAGVDALWAKSVSLFELFAARVAALAPDLRCVSPAVPNARGSHISFAHPEAYGIVQALIASGVVGDFRAPDIARFGITPLYIGYADVWRATETIGLAMQEERWRDPAFAVRRRVT
ncbi:MAG: aminotransferase class V-fold PLP-dependent enzyme, partial [Sphingomonadales bacterium]